MIFLKQSTAREIKLGPFVDETDGRTIESGLTITAAEVLLAKGESDWAAKNESTSLVHESNGWYRCLLDSTDTNTLGELRVQVNEAGAMPVWAELMVVPANIWDSWFSTDFQQVHAVEITAGLLVAAAFADGFLTAAKIATGAIDADALAADMSTYQAKVEMVDDDGGTADRYTTIWFKNSQPITSGITSPTIQVIKIADGSDLVAETAMTQIASLGMYRYVESTNRIVSGVGYVAKVTATIDGGTRTWYQPIGRDA